MVNIFEAKAKLSDLLDRAFAGERILICKRNQPVAELLPIRAQRTAPRPIGKAKGLFSVGDQFFQPLDDEDLEAFESAAPFPGIRTRPSHAAESGPASVKKPRRTRRPKRA